MSLSTTIRNQRLTLGLKQSDISSRIGGITRQAVSNWESGLSVPTEAHLRSLSEILSLDVDSLRQMAIEATDWKSFSDEKMADRAPKSNSIADSKPESVAATEAEGLVNSIIKGFKGLFK
ncbi:MAG: helix-turn-helix domain-containing protein [Clostridiaceae bacterium]|nr:helix-turn-helix domain-containing protein [Clostridiaceae bacterium]